MQTVTVYRSPFDLRILTAADTVTGEPVVPSFPSAVGELFGIPR
jgi:hypothetical protein